MAQRHKASGSKGSAALAGEGRVGGIVMQSTQTSAWEGFQNSPLLPYAYVCATPDGSGKAGVPFVMNLLTGFIYWTGGGWQGEAGAEPKIIEEGLDQALLDKINGALQYIPDQSVDTAQLSLTVRAAVQKGANALQSIAAGSIGSTQLADNSVITEKLVNKAVTKAKLEDSVQATLNKADNSMQPPWVGTQAAYDALPNSQKFAIGFMGVIV